LGDFEGARKDFETAHKLNILTAWFDRKKWSERLIFFNNMLSRS
jgi:hypothetical protein